MAEDGRGGLGTEGGVGDRRGELGTEEEGWGRKWRAGDGRGSLGTEGERREGTWREEKRRNLE